MLSGEEFIDSPEKGDATAKKLRRVLKSCPVCGEGFSQHSYALLATTVFGADQKLRVTAFFESLEEHRWSDLLKFRNWDALSNNVESYAIRCVTGRAAIVTLHSPYEVYEDDSIIKCEVLSSESSQELLPLIEADEWKPLQP